MNDEAVKKIRCLILYMVVVDFADSECEASAKSCYSARAWSARVL